MKRSNIGKSFIAFLLLVGLIFAPVISVYAEESENEETSEEKIASRVELDIKQHPDNTDGSSIIITALVYDEDGNRIDVSNDDIVIYFKNSNDAVYSNGTKKISVVKNIRASNSFNIYAEYAGTDKYESSKSAEKTIDVIKYASLKGYLKTTKNPANGTYGIYVNENYPDYDSISKLTYRLGAGVTNTVDSTSISVLEEGTYYVGVYPKQEGNKFYLTSGNESITVSDNAPTTYSISAKADDRVTWTKTLFDNVTGGKQYTTYAHINEENRNTYYIKDIVVEPDENADVLYNQNTGEISITNVTGNVYLKAIVEQKATVASLEIKDISVSANQNYSEDNASVQFTIQVRALDANENVIPKTTIYFKNDANEVSYTSARSTEESGIATFVYSYGIQFGELSADYHPIFALTSDFADILLETDIHLLLQQKEDLELYENQIVGTKPNENTGKVIEIPDNYEIWTGEVHQGALVVGSGQWVRPINGEFSGLSAGQHIIRFGEKFDKGNNTFYFSSDYADFFVPRGVYELIVNEDESSNVIYEGELNQSIEPGQTVYVYVKPVDGYEIKDEDIYISKPSYVSGAVHYSADGGYVVIEGISGSIELKIAATELEAEDVPQEESNIEADNNTEIASSSSSSSDQTTTGTIAPAQIEETNVVLIADENVPAAVNTAKASTKNVTVQKNDSASQNDEATTQSASVDDNKIETNTVEDETTETTITANEVPLAGTDDKADILKWLILIVVLLIVGAGVGYRVYRSNALNKTR